MPIDAGVEQGTEISPFYDPMIAKLIAHGPTRDAARNKLVQALGDTTIWPLRTNAGFLVKALEHPAFVAAELDTGLIGREGDALMPPVLPDDEALANAASALSVGGGLAGFRMNAPRRRQGWFLLDGEEIAVAFDPLRSEVMRGRYDVLIAQGDRSGAFRAGAYRA